MKKENLLTIFKFCGKMWEFFFYLYPPQSAKARLYPEKSQKIERSTLK